MSHASPRQRESRFVRNGQAQDELIQAIRGEVGNDFESAVGSVVLVRCLRADVTELNFRKVLTPKVKPIRTNAQ